MSNTEDEVKRVEPGDPEDDVPGRKDGQELEEASERDDEQGRDDDDNDRPRIALGSDHVGYDLKETIKAALREARFRVRDVGCTNEESVDYPEIVDAVVRKIRSEDAELGVVITVSGTGAGMLANKLAGVRAAACGDPLSARRSRVEEDANVLCLGAGVMGDEMAVEVAREWAAAEFSGDERHRRRLERIEELEAHLDRSRGGDDDGE